MQLQGERVRTAGCLPCHCPGWATSLMLGFLPASPGTPAVPCPQPGDPPLSPAPGAPMPCSSAGRSDVGYATSPGKEDAAGGGWQLPGEGGTSPVVTHTLLGTGAE